MFSLTLFLEGSIYFSFITLPISLFQFPLLCLLLLYLYLNLHLYLHLHLYLRRLLVFSIIFAISTFSSFSHYFFIPSIRSRASFGLVYFYLLFRIPSILHSYSIHIIYSPLLSLLVLFFSLPPASAKKFFVTL